MSWSKFHQIMIYWIHLKSTRKGLLENGQDGISRPLATINSMNTLSQATLFIVQFECDAIKVEILRLTTVKPVVYQTTLNDPPLTANISTTFKTYNFVQNCLTFIFETILIKLCNSSIISSEV